MDLPQPAPPHFSRRADFRAWTQAQPRGRFERTGGAVIAMAPERLVHTRLKANVWLALHQSIQAKRLPREALMDGVTVEIGDDTDYEPDAVVACGERAPNAALAVPNPVIVVEVLSPSTGYRDLGSKLADYFKLPSLQHYLVVFSDQARILHHSRWLDGRLLTRIATTGLIELDPPGLAVTVEGVYAGVFDSDA